MANVTITEFQGLGFVASGTDGMSFQIPAQGPFYTSKTVIEQPLMSVAGNSAAFGQYTRLIRVNTDAAIKINIGSSPNPTANSPRLAANQTEYFTVSPGDKLGWITTT